MGDRTKVGCGCLSMSLGCFTLIIMFLFLCWFFFMGGCTLIVKKTNEAISEPTIEKKDF
jgi:hypothetical protein